jgi:hypothetical protein
MEAGTDASHPLNVRLKVGLSALAMDWAVATE